MQPSIISVVPPPDLPKTAPELLALATRVLENGSTVDELTVAVAALEALAAGPSGRPRPAAFEVDFRMAKACHLIAEIEPAQERRAAWLQKGQNSAEKAVRSRPDRVEGTYYLAVIIGRQAEELGLSALPMVRHVEELGLKAMALDPKFENGGPYRLLAMVYAKAPPWPASIGDTDRALELAQEAVKAVDYPLNHYVLAEILVDAGVEERARQELNLVLSAPKVGAWTRESENWEPRARKLLNSLSK